jgi:hypothetical protein
MDHNLSKTIALFKTLLNKVPNFYELVNAASETGDFTALECAGRDAGQTLEVVRLGKFTKELGE